MALLDGLCVVTFLVATGLDSFFYILIGEFSTFELVPFIPSNSSDPWTSELDISLSLVLSILMVETAFLDKPPV